MFLLSSHSNNANNNNNSNHHLDDFSSTSLEQDEINKSSQHLEYTASPTVPKSINIPGQKNKKLSNLLSSSPSLDVYHNKPCRKSSSYSVIDETEELKLLYGTTKKINPPRLALLDRLHDVRVVILSDINRLDGPYYDSLHKKQSTFENNNNFRQAQSQQQNYTNEIPKYKNLRECVFGYSQALYENPVTKLHPIPLSPPSLNIRRGSASRHPHLKNRKSYNFDHSPENRFAHSLPSNFDINNYDFPSSRTSSSSTAKIPKSADDHQVWLVSRVFRLSKPQEIKTTMVKPLIPETIQKHFPFGSKTSSSLTTFSPSSSLPVSSSPLGTNSISTHTADTQTDTSGISEKTESEPSPSSPQKVGPTLSDYNVAICIFFHTSADSQSYITNYWKELTSALDELQNVVTQQLCSSLPLISRFNIYNNYHDNYDSHFQEAGYPHFSPEHDFYNCTCLERAYLLNNNSKIQNAVESFKDRFLTAISIPRVICGRQEWKPLLNIIEWATSQYSLRFVFIFINHFFY